jgi:hypothetical protein
VSAFTEEIMNHRSMYAATEIFPHIVHPSELMKFQEANED